MNALRYLFICTIACFYTVGPIIAQVSDLRDSLINQLGIENEAQVRHRLMIEIAKTQYTEDLATAISHLLDAIELADSIGDNELLMESLQLAGNITMFAGLLDQSSSFISRLLETARENNNDYFLGIAYFNMGALRLIMEDFDKGVELEEKGFEILKKYSSEVGSPLPDAMFFHLDLNLGVAYSRMADFKQGKRRLKSALEIAESLNMTGLVAKAISAMGDLYILQDSFQTALHYYQRGFELYTAFKSPRDIGRIYWSIGETFQGLTDYAKADSFYNLAFEVGEEIESLSLKKKSAEKLAEVKKMIGDSRESLDYLTLANDLAAEMKIASAKEELTRQELTDAFKEREDELHKVWIEKESFQEKYLRSFVVLAAVIMVLLFRFYRKFKKENLEKLSLSLRAEKLELEKKLLKTEVQEKDRQLATKVMYELQVNELINGVVSNLIDVKGDAKKEMKEQIDGSIKKLEKVTEEKVWEEFETRFVDVHPRFFDELNEVNPNLTRNDRRLAAFLRMDMSTKEIATITGQSTKAIEVGRTRLRKKLELTNSGMGLNEFLATLG